MAAGGVRDALGCKVQHRGKRAQRGNAAQPGAQGLGERCERQCPAEALAMGEHEGEQAADQAFTTRAGVPGVEIDPASLIRDLIPRMTHFMVPRYVRVLPHLPNTPTHKIQKHLLRQDGVTVDTWDREAAGVVVKRDRVAGL